MIGDVLVAVDALANTTPGVVLAAGETIDLDRVYGPNEAQMVISVIVAIAAIVLSALYVRYHSSRILEGEEAEHARSITAGLRARDRNSLRISADDDVDSFRDDLRALFVGDFESDVPSVRYALAEVRGEWRKRRRAATRAVRGEIPALARSLSLDGVLYLVAGVVAVESLETWGSVLTTSSTPPAPGSIVDRLASVVTGSVESVVTLAASYPFAGEIWAFAFIGVLEGGAFLYDRVYLIAGILLAGSVIVWVGDRLVADDVDRRLYATNPRAALRFGLVVVSTWFAGVAVATVARALHTTVGSLATGAVAALLVTYWLLEWQAKAVVENAVDAVAAWNVRRRVEQGVENALELDDALEGYDARRPPSTTSSSWLDAFSTTFPIVRVVVAGLVLLATLTTALSTASLPLLLGVGVWGGMVGLLTSFAVAGYLTRRELRAAHGRLTATYEQADDVGVGKRGTVAYVASRKVFGAIGVVAASIIPIYLFHALLTGKLFTIVGMATTESSTQVQVTSLFVLFALAAFAIVQTRPAWDDLAESFRYAFDRNGLRIALKTRGVPFLAVVLSWVMFAGVGFFGPIQALLFALVVGLLVRAFYWLASRAEHAYYQIDTDPSKPGRVFVDAVVVEDARGREIAVARENDHLVAAPLDRLDELVDQVVADVKSMFVDVEPEPSVYEYYYDRMQDGKVDFDDVLVEYRGTISKAIDVELEQAGRDGLDVERLDELLTDRFDEDEYRRKRLEKRKKPNGIVLVDGKARKK